MNTIARTAYLPVSGSRGTLGLRLLDWLVALDAGYRNAHRLAAASDEQLADMGIARTEAASGRHVATSGYRRPAGSRW